MSYQASREQHGVALMRALAYCLAHDVGAVEYEQREGAALGVRPGRVRFTFEVDAPAMWRVTSELRVRYGIPGARPRL